MTRAPRVLFAGGGTGGHLYPALAIASALQARPGGAEVFFLGARRGIEARVLPQRGHPHALLPFEPIRRSRVWENWRLVPGLTRALIGISRTFREFRPDLVVGTGGYASGPVVASAILRKVPAAIQEQNSFPGITTRWLASRVQQIHLAFPEALDHLRPGSDSDVFMLGNPIEPPNLAIDRASARERFGLGEGVVALVVGGSQGAKAINEALLRDLAILAGDPAAARTSGIQILWATGPAHYDRVATEITRLGLGRWVHVHAYIDQMPLALAAADLAISRAGAMALAELCAWGIPGILVPFPHAAANHQYHNALALAEAGAALMLPEGDLAPNRLWSELAALAGDEARRLDLSARAHERGHPNAAAEIADSLMTLL